ncbi:MAG: efflux RND transporter periplasmic adaptor subunit [Deltaproteobacteria bacterium]|nr:efflux RND transporter periplasmic adaptor subunit [Deltaproteobacteria bacterium]
MRYLQNYLFAISAAFSILICVTGCDSSESIAQSENGLDQTRAVKVSVVEVKPVPIRDILVLPGQTEAWQDILVPADTGGRVEWIGTREGDTAKKGQLLARIDVASIEAALNRAEAAFKLADDLYQRRRKLFDRKIINQEELDRSLTERTLAHANLRQARVEHERGFLKSPISGIINHLFVDEGEFVERGKPVADMVNVDKIKINVNVPELDVRYLKPKQKTTVKIDAFPDRSLSGIVYFIAYKADPATKTFLVRVLIKNSDHHIRPGMIARVAFLRRTIPDALIAPLFAIVDKGGERLLFLEKDGVAHARTVSIGVIEGDRVQITKGLNPGDHLIVTGQTEVEEGMKVQVR